MSAAATVHVRAGISLESLQELIAALVNEQGCPGCGLGGFDLNFAVDPETIFVPIRERFAKEIVDINLSGFEDLGRFGGIG